MAPKALPESGKRRLSMAPGKAHTAAFVGQDQTKFGHELDTLPPPHRVPAASDMDVDTVDTVIARRAVEMYSRSNAETDAAEVAEVCTDIIVAASTLFSTGGGTAAAFMWNERYQSLTQVPIASWQGRGPWDQVSKTVADFQATAARQADEAFGQHRASRKRSTTSGAYLRHVWASFRAAHLFVRGCRNLSQSIFEQAVTGIHVPLTALFIVSGEYVTVTALPPIRELQPAVLPLSGSVVRYGLERLAATLMLPKAQRGLTLYPGAEGRFYCLDPLNAAVVAAGPNACYSGKFHRPVLSTRALRNHLLFPLAGSGASGAPLRPGKHVLVLGAKAAASALVDTVEVQLARAQRDGTAPPTEDSVVTTGIAMKALRRHGVPASLLYGVLAELDELLRLVRANPELAKAGRDMRAELNEQLERMRLQDLRERQRLEAEDGLSRRKRKGDQGPGIDSRLPQATDYTAVRMGASVVAPSSAAVADSAAAPEDQPAGTAPLATSTVAPPLKPQKMESKPPPPKPSISAGPKKRVQGTGFLSGAMDEPPSEGPLSQPQGGPLASPPAPANDESMQPPAAEVAPPGDDAAVPAPPRPVAQSPLRAKGASRWRDIVRLAKLDGRWAILVSKLRQIRGEAALPRRVEKPQGMSLANVVAKAMRKRKLTVNQERQQRKKEEAEAARKQSELDALKNQRAGKTAKASAPPPKPAASKPAVLIPTETKLDIESATELHPTINVEAVLLCRTAVLAEMALRAFKDLLRAEIAAPEHNNERVLAQLRELRVQYVNRVTQSLYRGEAVAWTSIVLVLRAKFSAPATFEPLPSLPIIRYVIRNGPGCVGAVFDQAVNRVTRLKVLPVRTTSFEMPTPVKMVFERDQLSAATSQLAAEWEAAQHVQVPPAHPLAGQCVALRVAHIAFLIEIAFAKNAADELLQRSIAQVDKDPFAVIFTSAVAMAVHEYEGNRQAIDVIRSRQLDAISQLSLPQDMPFRSERERLAAASVQEAGERSRATQLLRASWKTLEKAQPEVEQNLSAVNIQRLIALTALGFSNKMYSVAKDAAVAAMALAPESHPSSIFVAKVSRQLLDMPVTAPTESELKDLLAIADGSVAYHKLHTGVDSAETRAAQNVYFYILHQLKGDAAIDQDLKHDIILALNNDEAQYGPEDDTDSADDHSDDAAAGGIAPALTAEQAAAAAPAAQAPGKRPTPNKHVKIAEDAAILNGPGMTNESFAPSALKPAASTTSPALVGSPAVKPASGVAPSKTLTAVQKRIETQTRFVRKRTRLLLQQMAEREEFWKWYCESFLEQAGEELADRQAIASLQEQEQRRLCVADPKAAAARWSLEVQETFFRRFHLGWCEMRDRIELLAAEVRRRTAIYQRDDMRRIHVREEFMHRVALVRHELYLRRVFFLPQLESLNHAALFHLENRQWRALNVEARTTALIRWEREERVVRQRWVVGTEATARRVFHGKAEGSVRRALAAEEGQERSRIRQIMLFVRLECSLRGVEYEEAASRGRQVARHGEDRRLLVESQHNDSAVAIGRDEVVNMESLRRTWLEAHSYGELRRGVMLPLKESLHRRVVLEAALEERVFLAEAQEYILRGILEHAEALAWATIRDDCSAARRDILSTPAMRRLEQTEAQARFHAQRGALAGALSLAERSEELSRSSIIDDEARAVMSIVDTLSAVFSESLHTMRAEFDRLQALFRGMHLADEALHREELLIRSESDRRWRVTQERRRVLSAGLAELERGCRLELEGTFQHGFLGIIVDHMPWIIAAGSLHEEILTQRVAATLGQLEVWRRCAVVDDEARAFSLLVATAAEGSGRDAVWNAEWRERLAVNGTMDAARRHLGRRAALERQELLHRSATFFAAHAAETHRFEYHHRRLVTSREHHERGVLLSQLVSSTQDWFDVAQNALETVEQGTRYSIMRSEVAACDTIWQARVSHLGFFATEEQERCSAVLIAEMQSWEFINRLVCDVALICELREVHRRARREWYLALDQYEMMESERRGRFWWGREQATTWARLAGCAEAQREAWGARASLALSASAARAAITDKERRDRLRVANVAELTEHEIALEGAYRTMIRERENTAFFAVAEDEEIVCRGRIERDWAAWMVFDVVLPTVTLVEEWAFERIEPALFAANEKHHRHMLLQAELRGRQQVLASASEIVNGSIRRATRSAVVAEAAGRWELLHDEHLAATTVLRGAMLDRRAREVSCVLVSEVKNRHRIALHAMAAQLRPALFRVAFSSIDTPAVVVSEEQSARRRVFTQQVFDFKEVVSRFPASLMGDFMIRHAHTAGREAVAAEEARAMGVLLLNGAQGHRSATAAHHAREGWTELAEPFGRAVLVVDAVQGAKDIMLRFAATTASPCLLRSDVARVLEPINRQSVESGWWAAHGQLERAGFCQHAWATINTAVWAKRNLWERVAFWRVEAMTRLSAASALHLPRQSERRSIIGSFEHHCAETIQREGIADLEALRRRVLFKATEVVRRSFIVAASQREIALPRVVFLEARARLRICAASEAEWTSLNADAVVGREHADGTCAIISERGIELLLMLQTVESERRVIMEAAALSESARGVVDVWYTSLGRGERSQIEDDERTGRFSVLSIRQVVLKTEPAQRLQVAQTEAADRLSLVRKESAWRECALRWDRIDADDLDLDDEPVVGPNAPIPARLAQSAAAFGSGQGAAAPVAHAPVSHRKNVPAAKTPAPSRKLPLKLAPIPAPSTPPPPTAAGDHDSRTPRNVSAPTRTQKLRAQWLQVRKEDADRKAAERAAAREEDLPLTHAQLQNFSQSLRQSANTIEVAEGRPAGKKPPHRLPSSKP